MDYILAGIGLFILVGGGDVLVRGAAAAASRLNVPSMVIGLTVVAFGTSAPELVVSLDAAVIKNSPELALGNAVGSNIANVLLVIGLPAALFSVTCVAESITRDTMAMIFSTAIFIMLCFIGPLGFWSGALLIVLLAAYLTHAAREARNQTGLIADELAELEARLESIPSLIVATAYMVVGLAGLMFGAHFLVSGCMGIARSWGVSDATIGLTVVAFGTSLPELATAMAAMFRRQADVAIGNVIGSNMFNLLAILGITSMVVEIPIGDQFFNVNFWVMLGSSLLLIPLCFFKATIGRLSGVLFLSAYVGYIAWLL